MHRIGEPAHDLFGEEINLNRRLVEQNIIPHRDAFLPTRKLHPDASAAVRHIKDRFDRHRRHPVGGSDACDRQVRGPADDLDPSAGPSRQNALELAVIMLQHAEP